MDKAEIRGDIRQNLLKILGLIKTDGGARIINAGLLKHVEVFRDLVQRLEVSICKKIHKMEMESQKILEESRRDVRKEIIIRFKKVIEKFIEERKKLLEELEERVTEQVISICEVVIDRELKTDRTLILGLIKRETERISGNNLIVYLNPDDFNELKDLSIKEFEGFKMVFVPDESLEEGDCVLECETGMVDVSLRKRLNRVKNLLKKGKT